MVDDPTAGTAQDLFNAACEAVLTATDAQVGKIFHSAGLRTVNGPFFAFLRGQDLVVKLPADRVRALVSGGVGAAFDAGRGRPMREWVRLRPHDVGSFEQYLLEARAFVAGVPGPP